MQNMQEDWMSLNYYDKKDKKENNSSAKNVYAVLAKSHEKLKRVRILTERYC